MINKMKQIKEEARKFEGKISKLSSKVNLDYSTPTNQIANGKQVDLDVAVDILLDMIDNQIRVGKVVESDDSQAGTQIVGTNVTKVRYNETSPAASFCDCYREDSDHSCEDALKNSDEHPSLFLSNLFDNDKKKRCLF